MCLQRRSPPGHRGQRRRLRPAAKRTQNPQLQSAELRRPQRPGYSVGVAPLVMLIWVMAGLLIGWLGMLGASQALVMAGIVMFFSLWVGSGPTVIGALLRQLCLISTLISAEATLGPACSAHRSDYDQRVYALVAQIPPGRLATYGKSPELLGCWGCARQVGWEPAAVAASQ